MPLFHCVTVAVSFALILSAAAVSYDYFASAYVIQPHPTSSSGSEPGKSAAASIGYEIMHHIGDKQVKINTGTRHSSRLHRGVSGPSVLISFVKADPRGNFKWGVHYKLK